MGPALPNGFVELANSVNVPPVETRAILFTLTELSVNHRAPSEPAEMSRGKLFAVRGANSIMVCASAFLGATLAMLMITIDAMVVIRPRIRVMSFPL